MQNSQRIRVGALREGRRKEPNLKNMYVHIWTQPSKNAKPRVTNFWILNFFRIWVHIEELGGGMVESKNKWIFEFSTFENPTNYISHDFFQFFRIMIHIRGPLEE